MNREREREREREIKPLKFPSDKRVTFKIAFFVSVGNSRNTTNDLIESPISFVALVLHLTDRYGLIIKTVNIVCNSSKKKVRQLVTLLYSIFRFLGI